MQRHVVGLLSFALALLSSSTAELVAPPQGTACTDLAKLTIPTVTITSAADVRAGAFTPPGFPRALTVPAFCRVAAIAAPTSDSHIAFEVWMPSAAAWNGKLLGADNGGFSGAIGYAAMAAGLVRGFATVGTDTGHTGDQMEFGQGHPDKIVDWAYRSVHVMTEMAKLIIRDHRGRFPDRSYFTGCSTGGQQALSEAQRFSADYDGIVAGDPGHNRVRLIFGFLWSWMATHTAEGAPILPAAKLSLLSKSSLDACDARDGLKDGLISDPQQCRVDPSVLACQGEDNESCLTSQQVAAAQKVYAGARNARTGEPLFPGWPRGSEQGWRAYITEPREPVRVGLFRYFAFHDPAWDWRTFDWDQDVAFVESQMPFLSATSRDLSAFKARGGKLIMYTGLADPVVPPQDTIDYYEAVTKSMGGSVETQKFFRFFPAPGMGHCGGGAGPNTFDALGALEDWVERGRAPAMMIASHSTAGRMDRTRPLCPYPRVATYTGIGSIDEASSFVCAAAAPGATKRSSHAR